MNTSDVDIKKILETEKTICVIGINPDSSKPSYRVPDFMIKKGYEVLGVYPKGGSFLNSKIYTKLDDVPDEKLRFVNVFRKPEAIPEVVDELIKRGQTKILWLQLGITHSDAEKKAEAAGMKVVSDRCLHIEYLKHNG